MAESARGSTVQVPPRPRYREASHPESPCPRCGGPWIRDGVKPGDQCELAWIYHCFTCGEVHYAW